MPGRNDSLTKWFLAASLILLLAHALHYRFLTDDAYISFRYARNLAEGHGLVFNPGGERVEGYTNFLWVILLSLSHRLGVPPEYAAHALTLACTIGLWFLAARYCLKNKIPESSSWSAALPLIWLACTRSFAVWSTGGLETRLFELLIVGGVFRFLEELGDRDRRPLAWFLFALASLTRPDGLLIGAAVLGAGLLHLFRVGAPAAARRVFLQGMGAAAVIGAHFLFRRLYYGEWLPNTYYAKAAGQVWWDMGGRYLACFIMEYAGWLWVPLLVLAVVHHRKNGTAIIPLVFGSAVLPHLIYILAIGGDHFEYRPLDLYWPFLFILMAQGLGAWAARGAFRIRAFTGAGLVMFGLVWLPLQTHLQHPDRFEPGFPGLQTQSAQADRFMDPRRDPVYRWPGLRWMGERYQSLLRGTTRHLVGFRQEGHRLFLDSLKDDARVLRRLQEEGRLPSDTRVALSSVGLIPYATDLMTLDRLGLTDAGVAHSPIPAGPHFIGHGKVASLDYAVARGVDLWAEDQAHLVLSVSNRRLIRTLWSARRSGEEVYIAAAGEGSYLAVKLPRGPQQTRDRLPRLRFEPAGDETVLARVAADAAAFLLRQGDQGTESRAALAAWLALGGRVAEALEVQAALAARNPEDVDILLDYRALLLRAGDRSGVRELEARIRSIAGRWNSPAFLQAMERSFLQASQAPGP